MLYVVRHGETGFDDEKRTMGCMDIPLNNIGIKQAKELKEKLELKTLLYENIEPYAQIVPLPGTQNTNSRLYTQLYFPEYSYGEIMLKSQEKFLDEEHKVIIIGKQQDQVCFECEVYWK